VAIPTNALVDPPAFLYFQKKIIRKLCNVIVVGGEIFLSTAGADRL
jgi:hypothetical protein